MCEGKEKCKNDRVYYLVEQLLENSLCKFKLIYCLVILEILENISCEFNEQSTVKSLEQRRYKNNKHNLRILHDNRYSWTQSKVLLETNAQVLANYVLKPTNIHISSFFFFNFFCFFLLGVSSADSFNENCGLCLSHIQV